MVDLVVMLLSMLSQYQLDRFACYGVFTCTHAIPYPYLFSLSKLLLMKKKKADDEEEDEEAKRSLV